MEWFTTGSPRLDTQSPFGLARVRGSLELRQRGPGQLELLTPHGCLDTFGQHPRGHEQPGKLLTRR